MPWPRACAWPWSWSWPSSWPSPPASRRAIATPAGAASAAELRPHRGDHGAVVGGAEDRAAGDEGVAAGIGRGANVVGLDAAVDLEPDVAPARLDAPAHLLDLLQRRRDEALAAEAGVDAHDEDEVDLVDHPVEDVERRRRVEHEPGPATGGADELQRAVDVGAGVGMKADDVGA